MSDALLLEQLLRRDRALTLAGLAALCVLAWLYILMGAGVGMSAWEMTTLSLFPYQFHAMTHMPGMATLPQGAWPLGTWLLMIAMWWIMMIAMMAPGAAPAVLLYARVHRHAVSKDPTRSDVAPTGAFAAGYLSIWLGFAAVATALHWALERAGLVSTMMMGSSSRWLSGAVLICAGLYQLSPLKYACLSHCRAPGSFLARHWRPHASGAFRLGVLHGIYCVGCCWMLMALLFVGGVMNVIWIAALALLVLLEKVLPAGQWVRRGTAAALIAWGVVTLVV